MLESIQITMPLNVSNCGLYIHIQKSVLDATLVQNDYYQNISIIHDLFNL